MTKLVTFLLLSMFVFAFGCGNKTEEQPPVDEPGAAATAEPSAAPAVATEEELPAEEAMELERVYMAQAQKEITADNAESMANALAREIDADIASGQ